MVHAEQFDVAMGEIIELLIHHLERAFELFGVAEVQPDQENGQNQNAKREKTDEGIENAIEMESDAQGEDDGAKKEETAQNIKDRPQLL
jgi:hypothetical protein